MKDFCETPAHDVKGAEDFGAAWATAARDVGARRSPVGSRHALLAQVVLVTGKGGVGKTTVAVGLAASAADSDQEAVVVE